MLLTRAQKHDEAIAIFTDLARQFPEERMVQMMLGQVYMDKKQPRQAKVHFENARKLDGSTPRVYTFLGNIQLIKGDYGKAREYYKTSLSKKIPGTAPGGPAYGLAFAHLVRRYGQQPAVGEVKLGHGLFCKRQIPGRPAGRGRDLQHVIGAEILHRLDLAHEAPSAPRA